jgi:tetratricopeptide (TPR) repeat protein
MVTQFETEATRLEDLGRNVCREDDIYMEVLTGYALNLLLIIHKSAKIRCRSRLSVQPSVAKVRNVRLPSHFRSRDGYRRTSVGKDFSDVGTPPFLKPSTWSFSSHFNFGSTSVPDLLVVPLVSIVSLLILKPHNDAKHFPLTIDHLNIKTTGNMHRRGLYFLGVLFVVLLSDVTNARISVVAAAADTSKDNKPQVPIHALQKAIQYVTQTVADDQKRLRTIQELDEGNVHTLYEIAKQMNRNDNADDTLTSVELWHALADSDHILSQVALGFAYAENDKSRAIAYFVQAGEDGPHQAALYNAGRLLAEQEDFVKALAYLRAAYTLAERHSKYATDHLTETSRYAYERLSEQLVALMQESLTTKGSILSIQQVADMFLYANINDFPMPASKEEKTWQAAMEALQSQKFEVSLIQLQKLEEQPSGQQLSQLQRALLHVLQQYVRSASGINRGDEEL